MRNQVYQRSPDMRFAGPSSIMNPQAVQGEIIAPQENVTQHYHAHFGDGSLYKPTTTVWNLNKILRRCGIPVPMKYCTRLWCVKDIGGYIAAGFTWFFIFVGELLIILNCLSSNKITAVTCINILVTLVISSLAFISHCKCMFSDPGTVPRGNATEENILKLDLSNGKQILKCVKCDSIKPDRAHHCSVCQRCIRKMDHHCPWINNCVGEFNQKFFVLFTGYVCLMSCYGFAISLTTLISCLSGALERFSENLQGCYFSLTATLLISICLLMESLMFGLFTAIMCGTQMNSICSDQTGIESLKRENRKRKTCKMSLREVFGGKFSYKWFSPFHETPEIEGPTFIEAADAV